MCACSMCLEAAMVWKEACGGKHIRCVVMDRVLCAGRYVSAWMVCWRGRFWCLFAEECGGNLAIHRYRFGRFDVS